MWRGINDSHRLRMINQRGVEMSMGHDPRAEYLKHPYYTLLLPDLLLWILLRILFIKLLNFAINVNEVFYLSIQN